MLTVGDTFPSFNLTAVLKGGEFVDFHNRFYESQNVWNAWLVIVAWPKDFTFVCPTEILGYNALYHEFEEAGGRLVGLSTDSDYVHKAWRESREDLLHVHFPWLSDNGHQLSNQLGIIRQDGTCMRATFIIDDTMYIRHVTVNSVNVGRSPEETLRILRALRTDALTPCGWKQGDPTL